MKRIAKCYVRSNGQVLMELCSIGRGKYIVTRNGQVTDARRKLNAKQAAEIKQAWTEQ